MGPVALVVDSKSKSQPKPWVLKDVHRARIEAAPRSAIREAEEASGGACS